MDVFKLAIHGTGYPLPGGYDELPAQWCIPMSGYALEKLRVLRVLRGQNQIYD
jgi:hypothetical protein